MSANGSLSPRQFGPGGKYTTRPIDLFGGPTTGDNPKYAKGVEAVHTNSGRRIGYLDWHEANGTPHVQGSPDPEKAGISKVYVSGNQRRKGIASAMLDHAREIRPGLQHSGKQALSKDGAAWAGSRA